MKVLIITSAYPSVEYPMSGIFIKEQVDSLKDAGISVDIFIVKGKLRGIGYLRAIPALWKELFKRYDVIHAHYGTLGWVGRMQLTTPLVISFLGDDVLGTPNKQGITTWRSKFLANSHRVLSKVSQGIIVQSEEMKNELGDKKALILPYGVKMDLFKPCDPAEARRRLGLDLKKHYILFANNPDIPVKRFGLAQAAFDIIKNKISDAELIITKDKIRDEIPLYMNACDVIILTSLHEGSPMVIKEAMACNLPIVSVDVGDVKKVVGAASNCFIAERDPKEIAGKIIKILESGERSNGRENIQDLEVSKVAQRVIEVYKKVCQ